MSTPLRELLSNVLFDPETRGVFNDDPSSFLADHGWTSLEGTDLEEAVAALADGLPIETAEAITTACEDIDFAENAEVGQTLAAVATEISTELPTTFEPDDHDLEFGVGATVSDAADLADTDLSDDFDELLADAVNEGPTPASGADSNAAPGAADERSLNLDTTSGDHAADTDEADPFGLTDAPTFADDLDTSTTSDFETSYLPPETPLDAEPPVAADSDDDLDIDLL